MFPSTGNIHRNIAEQELVSCLGTLEAQMLDDLATSLVRQWLTCDGHAGLVTLEENYWYRLTSRDDGQYQVVRDVNKSNFVDQLRQQRVIEEQIPGLLHEMNLCQCADCVTDYGEPLHLWVDPVSRTFHIELARARGH